MTETDIALLTFKRDSLLLKIELLHTKAQTLSITEGSQDELAEFKVRCDKVTDHYDNFSKFQDDLAKAYIQLQELDKLGPLQEKTLEVDEKYFSILAAKDLFLTATTKNESSSSSPTQTSLSAKLPKINLPEFDGTLKNWPHFRDLYKALVHENKSLSDIEKFHFLISSTTNDANVLVRSLPICSTNYKLVWNQLNDRYDNKRLLASQYVEEILNLQSVNYESPKPLRSMLDLLSENMLALKTMQIPDDLGNFLILHVVLKKLDKHTRQLFERKFSEKEYPTLDDFLSFLRDHCKSLDAAQPLPSATTTFKHNDSRSMPKTAKYQKPDRPYATLVNKSFHAKTETQSCLYCSHAHAIYQCPAYTKLSPNARREFIKTKEACFNCLSLSHMSSKCNSVNRCRKCNKMHHTSLHEEKILNLPISSRPTTGNLSTSENPGNTGQPMLTTALSCTLHSSSQPPLVTTLLGTALIQLQDSAHHFQTVRALIDPGSQSSFVTESCVKNLGLPRSRYTQPILGLSQTAVSTTKGIVSCILKPCYINEPRLYTNAVVLNRITSSLPSTHLSADIVNYFKDWTLADPQYHSPSQIDFLIGADLFPQIFYGGRSNSPEGYPTAFQTIFGWVLIGQVSLPFAPTVSPPPISAHLAIADHSSLEASLKRFWELEEPPTANQVGPEDIVCENTYLSTYTRDQSGRYIVSLPFKESPQVLGQSYERAKQCLLSLEKRFQHHPDLKSSYLDFLSEYETLGHMTRLSPLSEKPAYFIPHHGVFKNSDSTPKLRVVFNASAQTDSRKSLNDILHVGPKLQNDICQILSRFRLHPFVFSTDICKMYRQILVHPDDRKYQAILWRKDPQLPIETYLLNTVTYGVSSSPFLAIRTLNQLALDDGSKFPLAAESVLNAMFMDDCLTGADSIESCQELKSQFISLLSSGGFELRKWASNSPLLLEDIPTQHQEFLFDPDKNEPRSVKVLGLKWLPASDIFTYDAPQKSAPPTKRGLLSYLSRIFDPLGLVTPVVFWAKQLMQQLWTLGLSWDDVLPDNILVPWTQFCAHLPELSNLSIPRFIAAHDLKDTQLHGFCDASELGYACCLYLRTQHTDGTITVHLVLAKSKVAPLKKITIPKLELSGAYLLCKIIKFYRTTTLTTKLSDTPVFAWTDSKVALSWIRTSPHLLKTFVANRVAEIQDIVDPAQWLHTPSIHNPADCASRGLLPDQIIHHPLWWHGPTWLLQEPATWPAQEPDTLADQNVCSELRPSVVLTTITQDTCSPSFKETFIHHFSSFARLQRCTAWILRFTNNCRKISTNHQSTFLTANELMNANVTLVKLVQQHYFPDQFNCIANNKPCARFLQCLNPFIDSQGIIRVGGRIKNSKLNYDSKHPMLLPKQAHLSTLIINHYHQLYLHVGPRTLQSLILRHFWIISARQKIRQCLSQCLTCAKVKAKTSSPFMSDLPEARITPSRPFLRSGVDYGGPVYTKTDKLRKPQLVKSYICLFVCLSTKAIHLELVSSLSTDAFLAALTRFFSRRGLPTDIYSDHGTNFIGANRTINELFTFVTLPKHQEIIQTKLSEQGINWHFIPPHSPHFGGIWEAGIKSTKSHLRRVLGEQTLTFEEFYTLLTQIEAILNSRPLCPVSSNPEELDTLTPGHFLTGAPLSAIPQPDFSATPCNRLSRWQLVQQMSHHFWRRWSHEYLHTLQQRTKWLHKIPGPKIGDVVLIKEHNLPPLTWLMGKIIETHPGPDGVVRVATLRTKQGVFKRPVVKLCPLPIH